MVSIYEDAKRVAKKEVLRLTGLSIHVATEEQVLKGTQSRDDGKDFLPRAQMVVTLEPLSYELQGGKYGNQRTLYMDIMYGKGLDAGEREIVRQHGWRGVGQVGRRLSIPKTVVECKEVWTTWMVAAKAAGLEISITDDGQLTSPQIGEAFEFDCGNLTLPTRIQVTRGGKQVWRDSDPSKGEKAYTPYARVPAKLLKDYVIDENRPVIFVETSDDDTPAAAAPTTTAGGSSAGPSVEALAAAAATSGLVGMNVADIGTAGQQVNFTNKFGNGSPIFFSKAVQDAAQAGGLVDYLTAVGAISVTDGVIGVA
jgi:hypothetical protein